MAVVEFSDEDKEKNVLTRLLDKQEVSFKDLKESNKVAGNFDRSKKMRQQNKHIERRDRDGYRDRDRGYQNRYYNREENQRIGMSEEWRA